MAIEVHVLEALSKLSIGNPELALSHACIAVDATAKKMLPSIKASSERYKHFISQNMGLITKATFATITINGVLHQRWNASPWKGDGTGNFTFAEIIYHAIRCHLVHEAGLPPSVRIGDFWGVESNGTLVLPQNLALGLVMATIAAPANVNVRVASHYRILGRRINELWGQGDGCLRWLNTLPTTPRERRL